MDTKIFRVELKKNRFHWSEPVHCEKVIVQVKGGAVNRGDVATLLGDVENQKRAGQC